MSANWKTVRIYISSTFRDMQAERDHLARFVFTKLRDELVGFRIHLIDVDLRWGITGEEDALHIVREVIDECRPYFLCMLGGRYGWVPEGREESITADDVRYAVLDRAPDQRGFPLFYFREENVTAAMEESTLGEFRESPGSAAEAKLAALKRAIKAEGLPVFDYPAKWDPEQKRLTDLDTFGHWVYEHVLQILKDDPHLAANFRADEPLDEFAAEAEAMGAFIERRTDRYILGSREPLLHDMLAFAAADGTPNIHVLTGDSGSGKSSLLAKFVRVLESPLAPLNSPFVIPHFIGASAGSTDLRRTLRRICHDLAHAAGNIEPLPLDTKDLVIRFHSLLAEVSIKRRVILVFGALDQIDPSDSALWMNWLPHELPPSVRIFVSVAGAAEGQPEHQALAVLRTRAGTRVEKLEPLTEADSFSIIECYLKRYSKRLSREQFAALLAKPAGRLPLFIVIALEELRTLGRYDEITDRIREMPGDVRALLGWVLEERLARDPGFRDREGRPCGTMLAEKFAACLSVSRYGLTAEELAALIDPGDPMGNVGALLLLVRPYLTRRGKRLNFGLSQFREAAELTYLNNLESQRCAHAALADCFLSFADPTGDASWIGTDQVPFTELPFHMKQAGAANQWLRVITNFSYLNAVVEKVNVSTGTDEKGEPCQWRDGYYFVRDELENWVNEQIQHQNGAELIQPLLQVWRTHEVDFVAAGSLVMPALYRDLKAMQPKQAFDRVTRKVIKIQEGPLLTWCETERKKHENPIDPWEITQPPFEAYSGDAPFIFTSYAHKDSAIVYPELDRLHRNGFRIWYDEGIDPGNEWPDEVAKALARCELFIVFISPRSVESANVRNEINFAINRKKQFVAIHVEETALPIALELRMGDIQAILKWRMPDDRYQRQMAKTLPEILKNANP
jgi:hypothetical protein